MKSIGAVLAGFVAITVLSLATDALVYTAWGVPPFSRPMTEPLFGLAIVYRAAWGVCGGWIAAAIAAIALPSARAGGRLHGSR